MGLAGYPGLMLDQGPHKQCESWPWWTGENEPWAFAACQHG